MSEQSLMQLARAATPCRCGRTHTTDIHQILLRDQALDQLPELLRQPRPDRFPAFDATTDRVLLIADQATWAAAGMQVEAILKRQAIQTDPLIFPARPALIPDESAVFRCLTALQPQTNWLISIGSGSLNDLTRFVSHRSRRPYICVATAPSMDGYASTVAPMIYHQMKMTYPAHGAAAIVAQPDILAQCPQRMLAAGLGDILGKMTALADWQLGHWAEDEYYCPDVAAMVRRTVDVALAAADQLKQRDTTAVNLIMEGLLMTGIAMSYAGNSRPASGAEHHLSHFLEMRLMQRGRPPVLHGSKVGLMTPLVIDLYRQLPAITPDFTAARARAATLDQAATVTRWQTSMQQVYGLGAAEVIRLAEQSGRISRRRTLARLEAIQQHWPQILELVRQTLPDPAIIAAALEQTGGPVHPSDLGLEPLWIEEGIRYAVDLRDRFTILQLYADLGLTEQAVAIARQRFA